MAVTKRVAVTGSAPPETGSTMYFRQLLNNETACASYLFGCANKQAFGVVDPHIEFVDDYIRLADQKGVPIVAVFETHVQADHISGLFELVERTGATSYLPANAGVDFEHHALADGEVVHLGKTEVRAIATPGHAAAHHSYLVTDHARSDEPWLVLTGDSLLIGDAGRPDLHADDQTTPEDMARTLYHSLTQKLLTLPDHIVVYPSHFGGSVCGRGLSGNPVSSIGFERRVNRMLQFESEHDFIAALLQDMPPRPAGQADIVAANRGRVPAAKLA